MDKQYVALPDPTWEGTLDLFGSGLLCPCKLNFMCVCVYTNQFMNNKLYIYFYDLYSPVSSFFLCVCVCVYVCACICGMRESNRGQTVCGTSGSNLGGNSGSFWIGATMPM